MGRSEPRRRGRKKGEDTGAFAGSPSKTPNGGGMSNFHAPLIQWTEEESTWYDYGQDLPGRNDTLSSTSHTSPALIRRYRSIADSIYANELRLYRQSQNKNSDEQWVESTIRKGTLKDRIAAMSVTLSSDPVHKFYALDGLMSMVGCSSSSTEGGKTNSRVAQLTSEALEDLFINTLLPSNRKLLTLAQRPLTRFEDNGDGADLDEGNDVHDGKKNKKNKSSKGKKSLSPRILLLWRFEEMVKDKYELYLRQYMAQTLQDGAELQKIATLRSAGNLLASMPEGEVQLLTMMVNKLGDPEKKTAAAAGHQLRLVLQEHSNMQNIVSREVQQLAHRPHLAPRALYNCIVFLNQLQLKRAEPDEEYSLPASLVKTYFRLFEVAVQQNKKKSSSKNEAAGSMKSRLLSALLTGVNRAHPYLPEKDQDMEEHVDALYQIVHTSPPAACTQALMLLFHLAVGSQMENGEDNEEQKEEKEVGEKLRQKNRFYRALYATLAKGNVVSSGKHLTMYFNVLYKAMKYDTDMNRIHAFAKRLMSAVMHAPAPLIAASMYLIQEIASTHEGIRQSWEDIPDPESNSWLVLDDSKREPKAGIVDFNDLKNDEAQKEPSEEISSRSQRNPPSWEISLLAHHFHPSVSKFVNDLGKIQYGGDPLQDFGLTPFLDKFAYRNPKSLEKMKQKRQQIGSGTGGRRSDNMAAKLELPMNDPSFLEKTNVNEQDEFFHQFFTERARRDELKGITRKNATAQDSDDDSVEDAAQDEAFDAAETSGGMDAGGKTFEEYEAMWDTDDEEEAFVDQLAMSLMEDAAGGPIDIDDDPADIDDWGDLYADEEKIADVDDDDSDDDISEDEENTGGSKRIDQGGDSDEDAFMESADSDNESDNENSDDESDIDEGQIMAGLGVDAFVGEDDDEDDDEEDGLELFLGDDESDDEEEDTVSRKQSSKIGKKKKESDLPVFVDAEEYEAMMAEKSNELKRQSENEGEEQADDDVTPKKKKSNSRKKRRKSKRGN
jgi:ribosome biogenesis protein MAK21